MSRWNAVAVVGLAVTLASCASGPPNTTAAGTAESCAFAYSPETLARRTWAFDGTLTSFGTMNDSHLGSVPSATFAVHRWYKGGDGGTVTVEFERGRLSEFVPDVDTGTRLLVTGEPRWGGQALDDPTAWGCGFTQPWSQARAAEWTQAFDRPTHVTAQLKAFRDAAAATPWWATIDWAPPVTLQQMAHDREGVVIGKVTGVDPGSDVEWALHPYEGAPPVHQLDVVLTIDAKTVVRIPVVAGPPETIDEHKNVANDLAALAPIGATVVAIVHDDDATLVAMEADDGTTIGYYASMDTAVQGLTIAGVADAMSG